LSGYYQGATYHGTLQLIVSPMAGLQQPVQGQHGRVATDLDRGLDEQLPLTKISGDEPQDGGYIRTITQQRDKRRLAQRR
jgi:hypothetical protein